VGPTWELMVEVVVELGLGLLVLFPIGLELLPLLLLRGQGLREHLLRFHGFLHEAPTEESELCHTEVLDGP